MGAGIVYCNDMGAGIVMMWVPVCNDVGAGIDTIHFMNSAPITVYVCLCVCMYA